MDAEGYSVDGVRVVHHDCWGIVRKSVTEPVVSCRFEGPTAVKTRQFIQDWLQDSPETLALIMRKLK